MSDKITDIRQKQQYRYTCSASHEPIAEVKQGQRVRIHHGDYFENQLVCDDQRFREVCEYPYLNPQTGPIFINGVEEGDTLLVHLGSDRIRNESHGYIGLDHADTRAKYRQYV